MERQAGKPRPGDAAPARKRMVRRRPLLPRQGPGLARLSFAPITKVFAFFTQRELRDEKGLFSWASASQPRWVVTVLSSLLVIATIGLSIISGSLISKFVPGTRSAWMIAGMVTVMGLLALALIGVACWVVAQFFVGPMKDKPGSRLSGDFMFQFSSIAAMPILACGLFALLLFYSIESWFTESTDLMFNNATMVVNSYEQRTDQTLRDTATVLVKQLDSNLDMFKRDRVAFEELLVDRAELLGLDAIHIVQNDNSRIVSAVVSSDPNALIKLLPASVFAAAESYPQIRYDRPGGEIAVVAKLNGSLWSQVSTWDGRDIFILMIKSEATATMKSLDETNATHAKYQQFVGERGYFKAIYGSSYLLIAMIVLSGAAVWGVFQARRIAAPVGALADAASLISQGDLSARVLVTPGDDEIAMLGHTFNQMAADLEAQRDELITANRQSDRRRRFTEAVLSGVRAGVIGLDWRGRVTLMNSSACTMLGLSEHELMGRYLEREIPALEGRLDKATSTEDGPIHVDVPVDGAVRNFIVRLTSDSGAEESKGFVLTFDDVTDLVAAQRMSAWADVARRIAHEIRNPLTPIQLSAERLRRKYRKEVLSQPEIFEQCTDTIIRQVNDIGRMVDEFSSFARMPEAVMGPSDITELVRQATFLQRVGNADIDFVADLPDRAIVVECDARQISQAMINVLKNASEAIEQRLSKDPIHGERGRVVVKLSVDQGRIDISVTDNGCGLPKTDRHRLTEPYMTTRDKGTGLGLAIVKKIMEDHDGFVRLTDGVSSGRPVGAMVRLSFPAFRNTA